MAKQVFLQHKYTHKNKIGVVGFSWTTFFFGAFVPLFRGDFKIFFSLFLLYMGAIFLSPYTYTSTVTDAGQAFSYSMEGGEFYSFLMTAYYFLVNIFGAFFYNKIYTQTLIRKHYYPVTPESEIILRSYGIKVPLDYDTQEEDAE